jgi:hypothetical protein
VIGAGIDIDEATVHLALAGRLRSAHRRRERPIDQHRAIDQRDFAHFRASSGWA